MLQFDICYSFGILLLFPWNVSNMKKSIPFYALTLCNYECHLISFLKQSEKISFLDLLAWVPTEDFTKLRSTAINFGFSFVTNGSAILTPCLHDSKIFATPFSNLQF